MKQQSKYNLRSQSVVAEVNKLLCPISKCKLFFDDSEELAEHLLAKHMICITCYEQGVVDCVFQTRRSLVLHCEENEHKIFYCSKCFESTRTQDSSLFITSSESLLKSHSQVCRKRSNRVKKNQPDKCNKLSYCFILGCDRKENPYANLNDLYTHLANVHTMCSFCPDFPSFNSRKELVAHAIVQNHPSFYCQYCHDRLIVGDARRKEMNNHEDQCRRKTQTIRNTRAYEDIDNILENLMPADIAEVNPDDSGVFDFLEQT